MDRLYYSVCAGFGTVLGLNLFDASYLPLLATSSTRPAHLQALQVSFRPATIPGSSDPRGNELPMFRRGLNHTGFATTTLVQESGLLWNYTTGGYVRSSLAVAGGREYARGDDES
jgi:hypothetical protein